MLEFETELLSIPDVALEFAKTMRIVPEIHQDDFIYRFLEKRWKGDKDRAITNYYELGRYSANLVREQIEIPKRLYKQEFGVDWRPEVITDFASGYGGVTRHLA